MYKLMIADDNPYILDELSKIIDWEDFDFDLIGAYENGRDLLNAAKTSFPDLVITDISMPHMNGLQLSANLYQLYPNIKIIFISKYSEFEYARQAMNLHILNYIMKPIQKEQLTQVLAEVLELLQKEQYQNYIQQKKQLQLEYFQKAALSHYTSRLLFHPDSEPQIREELKQFGIMLPDSFHIYVVCYALNRKLPSDSVDYFQPLLHNSFLDLQIIPLFSEKNHGYFLLVDHNCSISVSEQLAKFCVDIETQAHVNIIMGYSDPSVAFSELPKLYEQAGTAIQYLENDPSLKVPLISYIDIQPQADTRQADSAAVAPHNYSEKVNLMRKYIHENYRNPINTLDVARSIYFSPSYANSLFSEECGITIFGYITQCRIQKAKEYLKNTNEQILHIAELVGYSGKTSFYLAFKRHVGISPTEYRSLHEK